MVQDTLKMDLLCINIKFLAHICMLTMSYLRRAISLQSLPTFDIRDLARLSFTQLTYCPLVHS